MTHFIAPLSVQGRRSRKARDNLLACAPRLSSPCLDGRVQDHEPDFLFGDPHSIYRFLGRPGAANYGQALAMSTLLMLVCTLGFLAIERFRVGEF